MPRTALPEETPHETPMMNRLVRAEPRAPWMLPFLFYLLVLAAADSFSGVGRHFFIAFHMVSTLVFTFLFFRFLPPLGRPHLGLAILAGLVAAAGWVVGQHALNQFNVGGYSLGDRLFFYPGSKMVFNPQNEYGSGASFWTHVVLKIARATTAVPLVEELFWRGFMLRAFVNWDRYDEVPLAKFSWRALILTSLLSTVQHPDNWGVSIGCWLFFNILFYWKKSLLFLMMTHAFTNLALYIYVARTGDWQFW